MTIEILEGEPLNKDGLRYKYKVRKNYQPFKLKKPKPERPPSPPPLDLTPKARGSALGKCFLFFFWYLICAKSNVFQKWDVLETSGFNQIFFRGKYILIHYFYCNFMIAYKKLKCENKLTIFLVFITSQE